VAADPRRGEQTVIEPTTDLEATAPIPLPTGRSVDQVDDAPHPAIAVPDVQAERRRRADRWRPVAFLLAAVLVGLLALAAFRGFSPVGANPSPSPSPSPSLLTPAPPPSASPIDGTPVPGVGGDDSPSPGGQPGSRTSAAPSP
jgi:hypothetical protein